MSCIFLQRLRKKFDIIILSNFLIDLKKGILLKLDIVVLKMFFIHLKQFTKMLFIYRHLKMTTLMLACYKALDFFLKSLQKRI